MTASGSERLEHPVVLSLFSLPTTKCWELGAILYGLLAQLDIYRTMGKELSSLKAHDSIVYPWINQHG